MIQEALKGVGANLNLNYRTEAEKLIAQNQSLYTPAASGRQIQQLIKIDQMMTLSQIQNERFTTD